MSPKVRAQIEAAGMGSLVSFEGYQPHERSVQALLDSQLLLLMIEGGAEAKGMLTGKLFEYLGSGTPILALAPEGEAAEILRSTGAGQVVEGADQAGIREALLAAWRAHRRGGPWVRPDPEAVAAYSRQRLTARLAGIFDSLRSGPGA
jgi:glycosyltransferase involved in cell wall biosynthesis